MKLNYLTDKINYVLNEKCNGNIAQMGRDLEESVSTIRNYIQGRLPSIGFIIKLHKRYAYSFEFLLLEEVSITHVEDQQSVYNTRHLEEQLRDKQRIIELLDAELQRIKK